MKFPATAMRDTSNTFTVLSLLHLRVTPRHSACEKSSDGFTVLPSTWLIPAVCDKNSKTGSLLESFHNYPSLPATTPTFTTWHRKLNASFW